jgi:hypothetical protein
MLRAFSQNETNCEENVRPVLMAMFFAGGNALHRNIRATPVCRYDRRRIVGWAGFHSRGRSCAYSFSVGQV